MSEIIVKVLRELVGAMYRDLHGAYGTDCYEGQYEKEIQEVADALKEYIDKTIKKGEQIMPTLWDAFLEDYANEIFDWTLRFTLEVFWHYCQDGSKGVVEFLKDRRLAAQKTKNKEISK